MIKCVRCGDKAVDTTEEEIRHIEKEKQTNVYYLCDKCYENDGELRELLDCCVYEVLD